MDVEGWTPACDDAPRVDWSCWSPAIGTSPDKPLGTNDEVLGAQTAFISKVSLLFGYLLMRTNAAYRHLTLLGLSWKTSALAHHNPCRV